MNVFMFHFGRSGSTILGSSISKIPGFFWHGEIFSKTTVVYKGFELLEISKKKGGGQFTSPEFLEFIRVAKLGIERQVGHPLLRYGCEIKSYHFEFKNFHFSLENALSELASSFADSRFIFLRRYNGLRRILSATIARQSGVYHVRTSVDRPNRIQVDLEHFHDADLNFRGEITAVLQNSLSVEKRYTKAVLAHGGFEICYEDHIDGTLVPAMELLSHNLGLEHVTPATCFKKTNPFPLSEMVENYDELKKRLSAAGMEGMLL